MKQKPHNQAIKVTGDNAGLFLAKVGCASALSLSLYRFSNLDQTGNLSRNSISKRNKFMSYIENNLMNGERIIYRSKLHWVIFFGQ